MGSVAAHELGHAVMAKVLCASPIQIVLGASSMSSHPSLLKIGGITLGGFNPFAGYAITQGCYPLKMAAICAAGPIFGALFSVGLYSLLKKHDNLYIAKAVTLLHIFGNTVGGSGIIGTWTPGTDSNNFVQALREYRGLCS